MRRDSVSGMDMIQMVWKVIQKQINKNLSFLVNGLDKSKILHPFGTKVQRFICVQGLLGYIELPGVPLKLAPHTWTEA